ncbi:MAG: hypothetical protein WCE38_24045 [Burkholderiales bacterium]
MTLSNDCSWAWPRMARAVRHAIVAAALLGAATGFVRADARSDALVQARHDLAISEQVLARLTERVVAAQANSTTGADERAQLDEYLARVRALVATNRARVRSLEEQAARKSAGAPGAPESAQPVAVVTEAERVAMLDEKLRNSLEAFDKLLLDEARKARAHEAEAAAAEGGNGGGGAKGGNGSAGNGTGKRSAGSQNERSGERQAGGPTTGAGDASRGGTRGVVQEGSPGGPVGGSDPTASDRESASAPPPPDVGSGNDDDIVARQIRKAAEAEPDPELRKKLWDEYRKYKQGVTTGASG